MIKKIYLKVKSPQRIRATTRRIYRNDRVQRAEMGLSEERFTRIWEQDGNKKLPDIHNEVSTFLQNYNNPKRGLADGYALSPLGKPTIEVLPVLAKMANKPTASPLFWGAVDQLLLWSTPTGKLPKTAANPLSVRAQNKIRQELQETLHNRMQTIQNERIRRLIANRLGHLDKQTIPRELSAFPKQKREAPSGFQKKEKRFNDTASVASILLAKNPHALPRGFVFKYNGSNTTLSREQIIRAFKVQDERILDQLFFHQARHVYEQYFSMIREWRKENGFRDSEAPKEIEDAHHQTISLLKRLSGEIKDAVGKRELLGDVERIKNSYRYS